MVYARYNYIVFMGFINQLTSLGGTILHVGPKGTKTVTLVTRPGQRLHNELERSTIF